MYQIGEHIMYKNIGICVVEEIGKPGFSADKAKEYYTLRPLDATGNARIYVPWKRLPFSSVNRPS